MTLFSLHVFKCFWVFSWRLVSSFQPLWSKKCLTWFQFSWISWVCFVFNHVVHLWKCSLCVWKECTFASLGEILCKYQLSTFDLGCLAIMQYFYWFFIEDLSIVDSGVLKYPTMTVLLLIFLKSSRIFPIYLDAPFWGAHMFTSAISSFWTTPLSVM